VPSDHGSRGLPAVRNHPPGCWEGVQCAVLHGGCHSWHTFGMGRALQDPSSRVSGRGTRSRLVGIVATVIRLVGWLFVLILVAHVALTLGDANPGNNITTWVEVWANRLQLGFRDLFTPADERLKVASNYGLAALVWLVVSSVLARLVRRLG
jgi:hypothetical protein